MYSFQSHVVENMRARKLISLDIRPDSVMPMALDSGSQNTENPYAMPMHRWMASAAGGTSQRLNPGPAIVLSRDMKPGVGRDIGGGHMTGASLVFAFFRKSRSLAERNIQRQTGPVSQAFPRVSRYFRASPCTAGHERGLAAGCHEIFMQPGCRCGQWIT